MSPPPSPPPDLQIYQRQLSKNDLADAATVNVEGPGGRGGGGGMPGRFARDELRQLFSLDQRSASTTRDLLQGKQPAQLRWMDLVSRGLRGGLGLK